jgi:mono/diheme cytochrome c family protein
MAYAELNRMPTRVRATATPTPRAAMFAMRSATHPAVSPLHLGTRVAVDTVRTTMDGVYTAAQATKGADVFATFCRSCHTPTVHTGAPFRAKWFGRPLDELFGYLRREMPKNEPGSMSDDEYALALAYLLRMNGMPAGAESLAADSAALRQIRLDSVRAVPSTQSNRR